MDLGVKRAAALLGAVLVLCAVATGCSSDDGDSEAAPDAPELSPRAQSAYDFAEELGRLQLRATSAKRCEELRAIDERSPFDLSCPVGDTSRQSLRYYKVRNAEAYGTGAIVDYQAAEQRIKASMVLSLTPEGEWSISRYGMLNLPAAGTSDKTTRAGYADIVDRYLKAVLRRDCEEFKEVAVTPRLGNEPCGIELPQTKWLADLMKADPDAKPRYLGGNATYGFFALETDGPKPSYTTIGAYRAPLAGNRSAVLDPIPGPVPSGSDTAGDQG
jgi:hypothetical protein